MLKRTFGKTGLQVTPLGFGGAPIGYLKSDQDRVANILRVLLDAGINLIDTAASYHGSEEMIGNTVGHRRGEFVLVSKCGSPIPESDAPAWSAALIAATIERSLRRLKTDRLDVMLLHTCNLDTLNRGEALAALVKARNAGKIRFAGYSGDNDAAAYAASLPDIAVIETSVSIADQANIDVMLPIARKNNIGVLAKRPIANAAWKDPADQAGIYRDYAQTYVDRLKKMQLKPEDAGFNSADASAWPELALRFTIGIEGVNTAIIGTTNPDNARVNIAYADKGPLPPAAIESIRRAFNRADPNRDWTGQG